MVTSCKLRKDDEYKEVDQRIYRLMIGSLIYVKNSRPNVMQAVGQVTWFQAAPKVTHVIAMKRIFKYLKGKIEFGLWYPKGNEMTMVSYTNADWAGSIDDRRSTSGQYFCPGDCLVSWLSKKKSSVSLSAT
jgi:hypothetical protein